LFGDKLKDGTYVDMKTAKPRCSANTAKVDILVEITHLTEEKLYTAIKDKLRTLYHKLCLGFFFNFFNPTST